MTARCGVPGARKCSVFQKFVWALAIGWMRRARASVQHGMARRRGLFSRNRVYSEGFLRRSVFPGTSGNIRLNAAPLAVSGSSSDQSSGWASSFLAEGSGSGGFTSSGIIAAPHVSEPESGKCRVTTRVGLRNRAFTWFWYGQLAEKITYSVGVSAAFENHGLQFKRFILLG